MFTHEDTHDTHDGRPNLLYVLEAYLELKARILEYRTGCAERIVEGLNAQYLWLPNYRIKALAFAEDLLLGKRLNDLLDPETYGYWEQKKCKEAIDSHVLRNKPMYSRPDNKWINKVRGLRRAKHIGQPKLK